ncbi:MAG: alpha-L-fucosidase [Puniceicoccaceae bacterium]
MKAKTLLSILAISAVSLAWAGKPFSPTWESLKNVNNEPEWFKDAKLGIYTHWGPVSLAFVHMEGKQHLPGWHGMYMYHDKGQIDWKTGKSRTAGQPAASYLYHKEHFGEPSEFGYKNFIKAFDPSGFDAVEWAELFEASGAQFAGPVAMHHDNFAMWDAKSTRWNVMNYGGVDVSGELKREIEKRGMKYMGSFHHAFTWMYFAEAHRHGVDPADYDLFTDNDDINNHTTSERFNREWWAKLKEFIDVYQPDLLWFDWWLENMDEELRRKFLAYYYNKGAEWGKDVAIAYKETTFPEFSAIRDYERGRPNQPKEQAWLTDTSPGAWFHRANAKFVEPNEIVDILIDITSKNGCMLLNVPPDPDGSIPAEMKHLLLELGGWLDVNGEAIYKTRPWTIFGEGPTRLAASGHKNEKKGILYTDKDIRFTKGEGDDFYAIVMAKPEGDIHIRTLASGLGVLNLDIQDITLLGSKEKIKWERTYDSLVIKQPKKLPTDYAHAFKFSIKSYKELGIGGDE